MDHRQKSRQVKKAQAVVRHDRPPKSPKMARTRKINAALFLETGFADFEEGFANFDDENINGTSLQWVSGDEESEV